MDHRETNSLPGHRLIKVLCKCNMLMCRKQVDHTDIKNPYIQLGWLTCAHIYYNKPLNTQSMMQMPHV